MGASQGDGVGVGADWSASHVDYSGMRRVGFEHFGVIHVQVFDQWYALIIRDYVDPEVIFGKAIMAKTDPEDVPAVAVGGVSVCRGSVSEKEAAATGEFVQLGFYSDVPVGVVFEDESRAVTFLYYHSYGVHVRSPGSECVIWHFPFFLTNGQCLGRDFLSGDAIYVFHTKVCKGCCQRKCVSLVTAFWYIEHEHLLELLDEPLVSG